MKIQIKKIFDLPNLTLDDIDRFEFEEQDDLHEFFDDSDVSDTRDLAGF